MREEPPCGLRYSPLSRNCKNIRLLEILPATKEEPLCCRVTHVDLDDKPSYFALSYTWGDDEMHERMICSDQAVKLKPNLYQFLRRYAEALKDPQHPLFTSPNSRSQDEHNSRKLWVDALCINQKDDEEKNFQVPLMKDIYTKAELVIAWLGEPSSVNEEQFITQMPSDYKYLAPTRWKTPPPHVENYPIGSPMQLGRQSFLTRSYWSRIWIVQEYYVPEQLAIMLGKHITYPTQLWTATRQISSRAELTQAAIQMIDFRDERENGIIDSSLSWTLKFLRRAECSNWHDKVYALLGLAKEAVTGPNPIPVNYKKERIEVMADVVRNQFGHREDMVVHDPVSLAILRTALTVKIIDLVEYFVQRLQRDCIVTNIFALASGMRVVAPLQCIGTVTQVFDDLDGSINGISGEDLDKHYSGFFDPERQVERSEGEILPTLSLISQDTINKHIGRLVDSWDENTAAPSNTPTAPEHLAMILSQSLTQASDQCNLLTKTPIKASTCKSFTGPEGLHGIVLSDTMIRSADRIAVHTLLCHAQNALILRQVHQREWILVGHAFIWTDSRVDTPAERPSTFSPSTTSSSKTSIKACCCEHIEGLNTLMLLSALKIVDERQMAEILGNEIDEPPGVMHNCKTEAVPCDRILLDQVLASGDVPLFGWH